MNRLYKSIMIAACVIMLFGCSSSPNANAGAINAESKNDQYGLVEGNSISITKSQNGYYIWSPLQRFFLYYMDMKTMKPVFLCNKPDCLHANEKNVEKLRACNAYLGSSDSRISSDVDSDPIYYESNVYIVIDEWNRVTKQSFIYLYKISGDGTKREKIYTFKEMPNYCIIHYDYLYYVVSDNATSLDIDDADGKDITKTKVCRINIYHPESEPEVLFEYDGLYAVIGHLTGYADNVYFDCYKFTDDTMQAKETAFYICNIQTGEVTQVFPNMTGKFAICGGKLVCYNSTLWKNYVSDLDGSMRESMDSVMGIPYSDDRYILTDTRFLVGKKLKDNNGNEITRNELRGL
jgi:hypothetical protein